MKNTNKYEFEPIYLQKDNMKEIDFKIATLTILQNTLYLSSVLLAIQSILDKK